MHELAVKNFNDLAILECQIEKRFRALRSRNKNFCVWETVMPGRSSLSKTDDAVPKRTQQVSRNDSMAKKTYLK